MSEAVETMPCVDEPLHPDQAMEVIESVVRKLCDEPCEITRDTRIDAFFKEHLADSLDLLEFLIELESQFGLGITHDDWDYLSGYKQCKSFEEWEARYASMFTFGRLADLIASRTRVGRVRPITILGSTSRAAGAFRAIERIVQKLRPSTDAFAPSTPILDRIPVYELSGIWQQIRLLTPSRIPRLETEFVFRWRQFVLNSWSALICVLASACVVYGFGWYWGFQGLLGTFGFVLIGAFFTLMFSIVPAVFVMILAVHLPRLIGRKHSTRNLLPHDIQTFADLARLIAGDRGGWCESCGYDLTGVESGRCPECGRETTPPLAMPFRATATSGR